ncbi:MAG: phosphatidylglycerophosphatase A [Rhodobiaceae bacterium]|nr:phosphatidylglycerophosphatase A [Rhodobiaceae bacterium]|tara:strand:- start:8 stop:466 length:459 start_codon:yes stop_codon:yes gene_type:complete
MKNELAKIISTIFYIGYSKYLPGTIGSLLAIPIGILILKISGVVALLIFIFILTLIALFSIEIYIKEHQSSDPKEIIIDEFIGQLIVLIFTSFSSLAIFIGFLLFRFFDISKLYPVNKVEKIKGSIGVLADDIVAGLMTCIIILLIKQFGII